MKIMHKTKLSILSIIFGLILCIGSGTICIANLYASKSKQQPLNHSLTYTMPDVYTGNYIVVNGQVYAEVNESVTDDTVKNNSAQTLRTSLNQKSKTYYVNLNNTINNNFVNLNVIKQSTEIVNAQPSIFGFNAKGELNITFIKDEPNSSVFVEGILTNLSFKQSDLAEYNQKEKISNKNIASTLTATYNNGVVEMTLNDGNGEVYMQTSEDASYTLGELVTNTNQILSVDNCKFSIENQNKNIVNNFANSSATLANLAAPHGRATDVANNKESVAQILNLTGGKFKLSAGSEHKSYYPAKLSDNSYKPGRAIKATGNSNLVIEYINFINFSCLNTNDGGAIYFEGDNLEINYCEFENNVASGNGGAIYHCGSQLIIMECLFRKNSSTGSGGAIESNSSLNISWCDFVENTASYASVIYSGSDLQVSDSDFDDNISSGNGDGVIYSSSGANISDCWFRNNKNTNGNGILYLEDYNNIVSRCNFVNNITKQGGAVSTRKSSSSADEFIECFFDNNTSSTIGGAVYLDGDSDNGTQNYSYNFNFKECNFTNNTAQSSGGAIYAVNCYVDLRSCNFDTNISKSNGGAINLQNLNGSVCEAVIRGEGSNFINNKADGHGGAVYSVSSSVEISDTVFESNFCKVNGGGIYINGGMLNMYGTSISNNNSGNGAGLYCYTNATLTGCKIYNNQVSNDGGGLYFYGNVNVTNTLVYNNTASWGAGIIIRGPRTLTLGSGTKVYGNRAIKNQAGGGGIGGAVFVWEGATCNIDGAIIGNDKATSFASEDNNSNYAENSGAGVELWANTTLNLLSGNISYNFVGDCGGGINATGENVKVNVSGGNIGYNACKVYGGGISSFGNTILTISGGDIHNNSSTCGGGIYSQSTINISGGKIYSNVAQNGSGGSYPNMGGGIFILGSTLTITDGIIGTANITSAATESNKSNWCSNAGGGIACGGGATLNLNGGRISANWAPGGGGIYSNDSTDKVNIAGVTISYNSSYNWSGGGLYSHGVVTMTSGTVANNSSATFGGGLMLKARGNIISGGEICYNQAVANEGGGIRIDGTATIRGTVTIHHNKAVEGGGISVATGATISGGTISGNSATNTGGGIRNHSSLTINGGSITGNSAKKGGGLYNGGTATISGGVIDNNTVTAEDGGGIVNASNCTISGGSVSNNNAVWDSKNIRNIGGTLTISGGTFNTSGKYSIYIADGTFNLNGNPTVSASEAEFGVYKTKYVIVGALITKDYRIYKNGGYTSIDDGDTSTCYVAYSTNKDYKISALNHFTASNLPDGRELYTSDSSNFVYVRHAHYFIDLNPMLDGVTQWKGISDVKFGVKINGVDQGYVQDIDNIEVVYGYTWEIYGAQYNSAKYTISGVPSSGVVSGFTDLRPVVTTVKYSISWNPTGGSWDWPESPSVYTEQVAYGSTVRVCQEPAKFRYNFLGWYTSPSGGTKVTSSWTCTGNRTLYAQWEQVKYTVTVATSDSNKGMIDSEYLGEQQMESLSIQVPYDTRITVNGDTLNINGVDFHAGCYGGYEFDHWSVSNGAYVTQNITIYAYFKSVSKSVTFNFSGLKNNTTIDRIEVVSKATNKVITYWTNLKNTTTPFSYNLTDNNYYFRITITAWLGYDDGSSGGYEDYINIGTSKGSSNLGDLRGYDIYNDGSDDCNINYNNISDGSTIYFVEYSDNW